VVKSGDHVYASGQVAFDERGTLVDGGVAAQTSQVLANLASCLGAAGCSFEDVVKVNVFLLDLADFDEFNNVYRTAFDEPYPARTTVQAGLPGGIRVEIEAVARANT
jgi:2-iminobutanoate/2-iminopropanoate deaminase